MDTIARSLTPAQQLTLAVQTKSPSRLAQSFAAHVGQFYDRSAFDALARRTRDLYAADSPERALAFQSRLNRRLYDRFHDPVAWNVAPPASDTTT